MPGMRPDDVLLVANRETLGTWHYLYETATGVLLTECDDATLPSPLPGGVSKFTRYRRWQGNEAWDPVAKSFVAYAPRLSTERDLAQEIADQPELSSIARNSAIAAAARVLDGVGFRYKSIDG